MMRYTEYIYFVIEISNGLTCTLIENGISDFFRVQRNIRTYSGRFTFRYESNKLPFGSLSNVKLSVQSYSFQFEVNRKKLLS